MYSRVPSASSKPDPLAVFGRIVPRDHALLALLAEHYLMSTDQITSAFFDSRRTAQRRLTILHRLDVLHRFGRSSAHGRYGSLLYTLGPVGLQLHRTAYHDPAGTVGKPPRSSLERAKRIAASGQVNHLLGVNQFFTDLLATARRTTDARLSRWWSEQHATTVYAQAGIRPDGHGIWTVGGTSTGFFLEHDNDTEFSGGRCPCRSPDLRVSAVQRLMSRRYRPRQVWCKQSGGVSPLRVTGSGRTTVHVEHRCGRINQAGRGSFPAGQRFQLPGPEVLSRTVCGPATESATLRAWCPCCGAAWGRCGRRCRGRYPDRPPRSGWAAGHGRFGRHAALLRKTLGVLSCGGGNHA